MRFRTSASLLVACLWSALCPGASASADVLAGDVIDKTNWEKIEGMVPEPVLNYVKKGDLTIRVGDLAYDPAEYLTSYEKQSLQYLEANRGKYDVNEEDVIVEIQSGKPPDFIEGLPFPEIDPDDPQAGAKVLYNQRYQSYAQGPTAMPYQFRWIGRGGFERSIEGQIKGFPMDGYAPRKASGNKENVERYGILQVMAPFDIAGTNMLLWRYRDTRPDSTFGYIPAIRRVRRLSPANRSDSYIGSDLCVDDAWLYDGKLSSFKWKLLRKQDGLLPFTSREVQPLIKESDRCVTSEGIPCFEINYERKDAQTAPWFPSEKTPLVWVKRPVYVVEGRAKDPYYNYGSQVFWIDAENPLNFVFKVIFDRADEYWKNVWLVWGAVGTEDGSVRTMLPSYMLAVDDRTDHATQLQGFCKDYIYKVFDGLQKEKDYSLAGFQRLCK